MTVMSYRAEDNSSRRVIDVAVGILVGLRGCSQREAFEELVRVVNQTGVGLGSVAVGLAALASGASSAGYPEAFAAWGNLVGRGRLASAARPY
jgi:ANTAR domain